MLDFGRQHDSLMRLIGPIKALANGAPNMKRPLSKPNIIYILADDMGYGDAGCNNPESKIPTPNLDALAAGGMRFTNAHAGSSVCTPSRYNILTGRYCWRSRLKSGIVWHWDASLIEPDQKTVAQLLKEEGYQTQCLGKWHLGWNWPMKNGGHPNDAVPFGAREDGKREAIGNEIDYAGRIQGGPVDRGFDSYFGVDVPNFPPYTWFENDRLVPVPTVPKPHDMHGWPGIAAENWNLEAMIPEFTRRAVASIEAQATQEKPLFLFLALTSPHSPIVPNKPFKGMSKAGNYGDFVCEVDWVVGQVCDALKRTGQADNTLLIFTSDNGPENRTGDDIGVFQRCLDYGHYSSGKLRGIKRDVWEGGHRVPFIARWPAVTPGGQVCEQLITLGDLMATCADLTGAELGERDAEDSVSILPLLQGRTDVPVREFAVHHSCGGTFAVRKGDWVYIDGPRGGGEEPAWFKKERGYTDHEFPAELFNLKADLIERTNRYADHPEVVLELAALLARVRGSHHPVKASQSCESESSE